MSGRLDGRLALITGASRGIGAAVAKRFAEEGADLILVARTVGGLEEVDDAVRAAGRHATLVPLDLMDLDGIDRLGASLYERFGKLDILVGNAGMLGELCPLHQSDPKLWETVFTVNVHANMRLIRSMDPLLRASDAPRAIFVTSGVSQMTLPFWGAYSASKAALDKLVEIYADENENFPIRVNLVQPGIVRTALRAEAMPGEDPNSLTPPEAVTDVFVDLAEPRCTKTGTRVRAQK
jgi:NAD(P)-dependent dehydrogenase (short-subunit alcohol dehydrogenase family)